MGLKEEVMNLGKKITTLIKSTVRSTLTGSHKRRRDDTGGDDYEEQLEALQENLADVEAKEREVANLLKKAKQEAEEAAQAGKHEEAQAKEMQAIKLEAHLNSQSTQAVALTEKLKQVEEGLAAQQDAEAKRAAAEEATKQAAEQAATIGGDIQSQSSPTASTTDDKNSTTDDTTSNGDGDLDARKSRLGG